MQGPDFICIGMPKAATGWLYDQLSHHAEFWMPPVKELHYLDREIPRLKNSIRLLENWPKTKQRAKREGLTWGESEKAFLDDLASAAEKPMDISHYVNLFRHKGNHLSGDISPGYCSLETSVIAQVASQMRHTKIVLLVREPIARVWSRICMAHREGKFTVNLLNDPAQFAHFLRRTPYVCSRSFPTQVIARWKSVAPDMTLEVFLFDDIVEHPAETIDRILTFIGANPAQPRTVPPNYNRKSRAQKLSMPDSIKGVLIEYLADEIRTCAAVFGGKARLWPSFYGI